MNKILNHFFLTVLLSFLSICVYGEATEHIELGDVQIEESIAVQNLATQPHSSAKQECSSHEQSAAEKIDTVCDQMERNASADGASIGQAVYCDVPKDKILLYINNLKMTSQQFAESHDRAFSLTAYKELAKSSSYEMFKFIQQLNQSKMMIKKNCTLVMKKVNKTISEH
ncbi:hypothetical protein [Iodobacter sp.]|uniref:hypothetical protein n=1 Tax=Iodobacter sp. TaxID=1915058 RepID=UPI0025ED3BF0|nr:hypothetical protein [Iodobacter sp.]